MAELERRGAEESASAAEQVAAAEARACSSASGRAALEHRRALDVAGWAADVTLLRKSVAAVDRYGCASTFVLHVGGGLGRMETSVQSMFVLGFNISSLTKPRGCSTRHTPYSCSISGDGTVVPATCACAKFCHNVFNRLIILGTGM